MRKMISRLFHLCTALLTSPLTGVGYSRCVDPISSYSEPCCPLTRPLALRVCFYCVTAQRLMVTSAHHLLTMWSGDGSFHPAPGPVTSVRLTCLTKEPRTGAQEGAGGRGLRAPAARRPHLHGHRGAIPAGSGRASGASFPMGLPLSLSLPYGPSTPAKARAELSERLPMKRNSVGACDLPPPPGPGRG